jgi:MFS family permease
MSHALLVASSLTGGAAVGFVPTLVDHVKTPLAQRLGLSEGRTEGLLRLFYLLWLPAMPLAGWLLDHWAVKEVFFYGMFLAVLGVAWLALAQSVWALLASILLLGLGYSAFTTAVVRVMPLAFAFRHDSSTVAAMNVGFLFVALGAVVGPWLLRRLGTRWGYRQGLLYLAFTFIVPAALVVKADFPAAAGTQAWGAVLEDARLWLIGGVILVYFAIENCLEVWPEPYLVELGYRGSRLTGALLLFWGLFALTRFFVGWLPDSGWEIWLLLVLVLASGMTLGNLVGANEYSSGSAGFWLTGAFYGPLLPGFLALVLVFFPETPGTALGVMLSLSGLDTLIMRPVMNRLAKRRPVRTVMVVPAVLAILLAAPLLVLALIRG